MLWKESLIRNKAILSIQSNRSTSYAHDPSNKMRIISSILLTLVLKICSIPSNSILSPAGNLVAYDDMDGHQWAARPLLEDAGDSIFLSEFQVKTVQCFWVNKSLFTDRIETDFCQLSWFQLKRPSRISIVIRSCRNIEKSSCMSFLISHWGVHPRGPP